MPFVAQWSSPPLPALEPGAFTEQPFVEPPSLPIDQIPFDQMAVVEYHGDLGVDTLRNDVRDFHNRRYVYFDVP